MYPVVCIAAIAQVNEYRSWEICYVFLTKPTLGPTGDSESVLLSRRSSCYEAIVMGEMQEDGV